MQTNFVMAKYELSETYKVATAAFKSKELISEVHSIYSKYT
jgi:hypothetical protein